MTAHPVLRPIDGRQTTGINPLRVRAARPSRWVGQEVPERKWIVEDLIPAGTVTLISGDGGLGKSLLAIQLQTAAAIGVDWLGRRTAQCASIALYGEDDDDEIHRRMSDVTRHYGVEFNDSRLDDMQFNSVVGQENSLCDFATVFEKDTGERRNRWSCTPMWGDILDWAMQEGAQLVILDSLHDFFHGNENDRAQVRYFVNQLRVIAQEIEGAVVLLAHPSVAGMSSGTGASGSTGWNNAVRSRLYLTRPEREQDEPEDNDARVLTTKKSNYGKIGDTIKLRWRQGVFEAENTGIGGMVESIEARNVQQKFLDGLKKLAEQGRGSSDAKSASTYAPRLVRSLPGFSEFSVRQYAGAMSVLQGHGTISRTRIGTGLDRHPVYGLAETTSDLLRVGAGEPPAK